MDDNEVARKMLATHQVKNNMLALVLKEKKKFATMTPQELL